MRFSNPNLALNAVFACLFFFNFNTIKSQNITVNQDPKIDLLMAEKRKINAAITVTNRYKIQIFNGTSEASKKVLSQFKKENNHYDATIVFNTPSYKVWIGNFKSRIEAERNLITLKRKYPNALVIQPNKS